MAIGAAVGFYGGGIATGRFKQFPPLIDRAGELKTPWLGLFGDLDSSIPVEDVELIRERTAAADVPTDVLRYATRRARVPLRRAPELQRRGGHRRLGPHPRLVRAST